MKYIKLLLISILTFFVLFTLIGLLFPSTIKSVRAVVVNKKHHAVLAELNQPGNWVKWYPFFALPADAAVRNGAGGAIIFSNNQKELQISNWKTDSNGLSFSIKAWNGIEATEQLLALPINDDSTQTQLVWNESEHLKWYPWERFRGLLLESTKGIYIDSSLYRFKAYIEAIK